MFIRRRDFAMFAFAGLGLAACNTSSSQTSLAQAKAYMDAGVAAVLAAAQQYLMGPPAPAAAMSQAVSDAMAKLESLKTTLDTVTLVADWKSGAMEVLALIQQILPMVTPFLGAAAPYVPLAIAVITAFIASLPPPADAPATPPAALTRKAAEYHHH